MSDLGYSIPRSTARLLLPSISQRPDLYRLPYAPIYTPLRCAIAFRALSATTKVASGNMLMGFPTGHVLNDILMVFTNQQDNIVCSLSTAGWTNIAAGTGNNGTNDRCELWAKRDNGAESAPTITHALGGVSNAVMAAFSGVDSSLTISTGTGSVFRDVVKATGTSTTSYSAPANTGVVAGDMGVTFFEFTNNDTSGSTLNNFGTVSGWTEDRDDCSSLGGAWASAFGIDHLLSASGSSVTSAVGWAGAITSWTWQGIRLTLSSAVSGAAAADFVGLTMLGAGV